MTTSAAADATTSATAGTTATTTVDDAGLRPTGAHDDPVGAARVATMLRALPRYGLLLLELAWRGSPGATIASAVLHLLVAAGSAFGLLAAANALTQVLGHRLTSTEIRAALPTIAVVAISYALRGLAESGAAAADARLTPSIRRVAEERLIVAASTVDLVAYDDPDFHDALLRARDRGAPYIDRGAGLMIELAGSMMSLVAMGGTLAVLNPLLLLVIGLSVLPQAWSSLRSARLGYAAMVRTLTASRRLWLTSDLLAERPCAAEIRAFTAAPFLLATYRRLAAALEQTQVRLGYTQARAQIAGRALSGIGVAAAYGLLGLLLANGSMPVGVAGAALIAIQAGRAGLTRSANALNLLYEQSLYVGDYARFLDDAAGRTRPRTGLRAPTVPAVIAVRDATFTYPGQQEPAVRAVSVTVRRGETLALVGENGSGKTTLARLVAGLYQPESGSVCWDGVDLRQADAESVYEQVAMVMQEPARWPLSVRQNIVIGRPGRADPDGAVLAAVASASQVDDLVARLPGGWETLLSKQFIGGRDLSGGQWQRLAVARAVYRDCPVLICDEPTAALDASAEAAVHATLRGLAQGRTTLFITHRLALARDADHIAVLHRGRLVEYGSHDELLAAGGRYAAMYRVQARAYASGS